MLWLLKGLSRCYCWVLSWYLEIVASLSAARHISDLMLSLSIGCVKRSVMIDAMQCPVWECTFCYVQVQRYRVRVLSSLMGYSVNPLPPFYCFTVRYLTNRISYAQPKVLPTSPATTAKRPFNQQIQCHHDRFLIRWALVAISARSTASMGSYTRKSRDSGISSTST